MRCKLVISAISFLAAAQVSATPIGIIQGSGNEAKGGTHTIEAVVTGVYKGLNPAGFYVQDETASADGNPATSDAIFVVQKDPKVAVGDKVRITGTVREDAGAPSFTQAVLLEPEITVLSSGNALPAFVMLQNDAFSARNAERYEGMLVQFALPLTVIDNYSLKLRGQGFQQTQRVMKE